MTRRYRSNPAVIPFPFPVPVPITETTQQITKPPSPTAIQFTCFGIPIYQSLSVPTPYVVANVKSTNVFQGCSGDTCVQGVVGVDIKGYVFLPVNSYAFIFACEAPISETQETQTIIVLKESTQLYNTEKAIEINQLVQGQFVDKSEVLSISYGDVNITGINYLSFTQTGLQIATKFSVPLYDRLSVFKTPFEIIAGNTIYLEIAGKGRPELSAIVDFMQSLDAKISRLTQTDYLTINEKGGLTNVENTQAENQISMQVMFSIAFGHWYQFNVDNILTQTEIETEIGKQLHANNIIFETELTIQ